MMNPGWSVPRVPLPKVEKTPRPLTKKDKLAIITWMCASVESKGLREERDMDPHAINDFADEMYILMSKNLLGVE